MVLDLWLALIPKMSIYRIKWGLIGINSSHEKIDCPTGNPQMDQLSHWGMTAYFTLILTTFIEFPHL